MNSVKNLTEELANTNKYYTDANYGFVYNQANCTYYAYDSALYLMDNGKQKLFNRSGWFGNANVWYNEYKYDKGSEPKVGAIMCWKVSDGGNTAGHVAICTAVNSNGTVDMVAGAYGGKKFYKTTNYNYKKSNFAGFCYLPNYEETTPTPTPTPTPSTTKTVEEVAKEVINGKWGNGSDRKTRLEAAGYNYSEVQAKVNELLHSNSSSTTTKSIDTIAREVINGKWGNGADRRKKLEAAGYDYLAVQKKVNQLLKK